MILEIKDLPPCPRNRSHMVTRNMLIKTPLCREFEKDLTSRLEDFQEAFRDFSEMFDVNCKHLSVTYLIYTPSDSLFKKDGGISSRSVDVDAHKVMQDVLFKCIGVDDKFIRNATYFTPVSEDGKWNYKIFIEICDNDTLYV